MIRAIEDARKASVLPPVESLPVDGGAEFQTETKDVAPPRPSTKKKRSGQGRTVTQGSNAAPCDSGAIDLANDQSGFAPESYSQPAGGDGHWGADNQPLDAVTAPPFDPAPWALVVLYADMVDDMERVRIANENRYRTLTHPAEKCGKGMPEDHPDVRKIREMIEVLQAQERMAIPILKRTLRLTPLGALCKETTGLGEKTVARFVGLVGNPAWHVRENRPRTLSELYAYCGLHVINPAKVQPATTGSSPGSGGEVQTRRGDHVECGFAPRLVRGEKANWSTKAKTRAYCMAEPAMKNRASKYRKVYDDTRAKYADAVHYHDCPRCKASAGEPLNTGHQHARAMRAVMKAQIADIHAACIKEFGAGAMV